MPHEHRAVFSRLRFKDPGREACRASIDVGTRLTAGLRSEGKRVGFKDEDTRQERPLTQASVYSVPRSLPGRATASRRRSSGERARVEDRRQLRAQCFSHARE